VAGDDFGFGARHFEQDVGRGEHAGDAAVGGVVDKRVKAVEEKIAGLEDVGVFEVEEDVGVGVGGGYVGEGDGFIAVVEGGGFGERDGGAGGFGGGFNGHFEELDGVFFREAFVGVFVGDDGGARGREGGVAAGVVEVPVGVDQEFEGVWRDAFEGGQHVFGALGDAAVDHKLAGGGV